MEHEDSRFDLHGDNEFEKIRVPILPTNLTVAAANEHIGTVERSVRTVKESSRAGLHGIPYKQVPIAMIKGLLTYATMLANAFPTKAGISNTLSPRNIVQGLPNIDFANLKYEFGEYGELSEDSTVTNTQGGRQRPYHSRSHPNRLHQKLHRCQLHTHHHPAYHC